MQITLPARPPFSLHAVVWSHGWIQLPPFTGDADTPGLTYVDHLASGRVVELRVRETPGGVSLEVDGELSVSEASELTRKLTWMLGLEQDFSTFYALAETEPKLAQAVKGASGRILRSPTLFEDILKTILTTNTLWAATIRMDKNLVAQFGAAMPSDPGRHAFPTPQRLAETDEDTLRSATRLGYRAPYVLELAQRAASGDLDLEALKTTHLPTLELRKQLLAIKGVGPYAAANLLMLLGRYDFIPIDSWAMKIVSHEWYNDEPVGKAQVESPFEKWGEWKGLAFWLWDWSYRME